VQQEHAAASLGQEERHEGRIRLRRVALAAGEDQIVRTVVCRLAAAGPHVIEGDEFGRGFDAAISAHRTMLREEPLTMRLHAAPGRAVKHGGSSGR